MASIKKVSIGDNSVQVIFLLSIFVNFFSSFVGDSLCLFNDYSKKKLKLLIFQNNYTLLFLHKILRAATFL